MKYLAHTKDGKNYINEEESQSLKDHLYNVAAYAGKFAAKFGAEDAGRVIGLLHDYGKYSKEFQTKIRGKSIKAPHAFAGAAILQGNDDFIAKLYGMLIAGHHAGLANNGNEASAGDGTYYASLAASKKELPECDGEIIPPSRITHKKIIASSKTYQAFALATYLKMLFSALVDADWTDTEEYSTGRKREPVNYSVDALLCKLNQKLPVSDGRFINNIRAEILQNCLKHAQSPQGLFTLTVPTGGGKTISSLAFALNHAKEHNLARVIYVIPYTSIIEQNAQVIAGLIGQEFVLEHHSNILRDSDDFRVRWATENWNIPIIVTTNVQFFESFFARKPSQIRKLHNIAKSVIIFDEAQMLPREYLSPSLYAISELVVNYGSTAVLCSATQPRIQNYKYKNLTVTEITNDPLALAQKLERVKYINIGKKTDEEILAILLKQHSGLIIVNSRRHAFSLFSLLAKTKQANIFCLSTLIPPVVRREKIRIIKEKLKNNERVYVISTQLIEAGVDVDFPVVLRSVAGIDSIIQAGGRANREGKLDFGQVMVFEPASESGKTPRSLKLTAGLGKEVIASIGEKAFTLEGIAKYFDLLYGITAENGLLDTKNILDEFEILNNNSVKLNFKTVAEKFKIIEDNAVNIIIPIDEASRDMVLLLKNKCYTKNTIRNLGQYGVSIYEHEFNKLVREGAVENIDVFYVLNNSRYYNDDTGLDIFSGDNKNAESYFI